MVVSVEYRDGQVDLSLSSSTRVTSVSLVDSFRPMIIALLMMASRRAMSLLDARLLDGNKLEPECAPVR